MDTFRAIIELWPTVAAFGNDIDVKYVTAQGMHRRDAIPSEYWPAVVEAAKHREFVGVSLELLASLSAAKRTAARKSTEASSVVTDESVTVA